MFDGSDCREDVPFVVTDAAVGTEGDGGVAVAAALDGEGLVGCVAPV